MTAEYKSVSRRGFLKTAVFAAGAAPFLLPSRVWAAKTKPNDRLALGFIGMGKMSRSLMDDGFLRHDDVQVLAVCDVDTNRRERARKAVDEYYARQTPSGVHRSCAAYNDFRDLLARRDIDAVVISTPDHWHAFIAIAAANAGKDIYCEKPLCQTIREAQAMVKAVRKNKRVFQTGSMQRSMKEFRVACELVRNGAVGKIKNIEVCVGAPGIPCDLPAEADEPGLDWDMWLGPAPLRPYNSVLSPRGLHNHFPDWRKYREYGGGMITDWGAHHFDIAQWGLGMDESGPVEIIPPAGADAKDGARFRYANGVEVLHKDGNGVTFFGSRGKIYVNRGKFEIWLGDEKKTDNVGDSVELAATLLPKHPKRLYKSSDHKADWLSCIRTRRRPIADVEIGAHTVTVCHLVNLAYYHGQRIQWNPRSQKFTGGTGDKKWLERSYRGAWKLA